MVREVSGFLFTAISGNFYTIRQFYAKLCYDLCSAKRVLFRFGDEIEDAVDGCRLVRRYIRKRIHGSANGQPELSTAEEVNVKNMEVFL